VMHYALLTVIGTAIVLLIMSVTGCAPARDRTDWGALAHGVGEVERH
jgi:hypothetical protein